MQNVNWRVTKIEITSMYSVKKMHVPDGAVPLGYGQGSTY